MQNELKSKLENLSEEFNGNIDIISLKALCLAPESEEIIVTINTILEKLVKKFPNNEEILGLLPKKEKISLESLIDLLDRSHAGDINFITLKALVYLPEGEEKEKAVTASLKNLLKNDRDNEYILEYLEIDKNKIQNSDMVFVKGGKYTPSFMNEEREVTDLEVCKYQTYQDMWMSVMEENPSNFEGGRLPVEKVSWWDALEFCNKLSEKEGFEPVYQIENGKLKINQLSGEAVYPDVADFRDTEGYRLPTELEWEWFARGGEKSSNTKYSGSDNIDEVAWWSSNSGKQTHAVGTKKPNELGLYDCTGNVWEWCYDTSDNGYIAEERPYIYDESVGNRRLRGGSWYVDAISCELSYRNYYGATFRSSNYGFRVCRTK